MINRRHELAELGWNDWFEQRAELKPADRIARVVAVDRDRFLLMDRSGVFGGKLSGRHLYRRHLSRELPCIGDWVCFEKQPGDDVGLIHTLLERRTELRRKTAGKVVDHQILAANVDYVLIVQSCFYDFNLNRLERYLVMVSEGGAKPYILLTKTDLVDATVPAEQSMAIRSAGITAPILTLSNVTREGIDELRQQLLPGKTYCFVGSSGVGKSTLINRLIGREMLETKDISGTGEGRHTTVRRELIRLEGGALVIDNPGMREFGILAAEEGITDSFSDITALSSECRFRDCTHTGEPGCAVLAAVRSGELSREHFNNYQKLRKESEFYDMSYAEKRKKDRNFGKFLKSAKKDSRERRFR